MNLLPLHPIVVHLPIALAVLMPVLSASLLPAWAQDLLPRRSWMIAVLLQSLLLVSGVVSLRTGQREEDRVERFVAERLIEQHEEAAETVVWGAGGVLVLALAAAVLRNEANARRLAMATTLGTLLVTALAYRAGEAGGRLVCEHGAANA